MKTVFELLQHRDHKTMRDDEFCKYFEHKIDHTVKRFNMIKPGDKVLVACSGGKDSTVLLYVLHKLGYHVEAFTVDVIIGRYTKKNLENLQLFCSQLGVKLHEKSFKDTYGYSLCYIKARLYQEGLNLKSCTVCGVLRRKLLNQGVRENKASTVMTGHNMDDEVEAVVMNFMKNNLKVSARLGPVPGILRHESFVPRGKPLYFCSEDEVIRYSKINQFPVEYEMCPCSVDSQRRDISDFLEELEQLNPLVKYNIMEYFVKILPNLRKKYAGMKEEIGLCSQCGEPSSKELCRPCQILSHFKPKSEHTASRSKLLNTEQIEILA